jgi:hypothetical protein
LRHWEIGISGGRLPICAPTPVIEGERRRPSLGESARVLAWALPDTA